MNCRVLEIRPREELRYAWVVGPLETVVRFTLTPTPDGTHLHIEQSGFKPDQKQNFGGARYGWNLMTGKLVDLLTRAA